MANTRLNKTPLTNPTRKEFNCDRKLLPSGPVEPDRSAWQCLQRVAEALIGSWHRGHFFIGFATTIIPRVRRITAGCNKKTTHAMGQRGRLGPQKAGTVTRCKPCPSCRCSHFLGQLGERQRLLGRELHRCKPIKIDILEQIVALLAIGQELPVPLAGRLTAD